MTPGSFHAWGADHKTVLAGVLIAGAWMSWHSTCLRQNVLSRRARAGIGVFLLALGVVDWIQRWLHGSYLLPFQFCDVALILAVLKWFFPKHRKIGEVTVLWALSGSLQALLTPDLSRGFPSIPWIFFFGAHVGVILSAVYFLCSGDVKLSRESVWRVSFWTYVYGAVVGLINWLFHFNYGFLARKPAHPSVLDYFGPWPYYIAVEGALSIVGYFIILAVCQIIEKISTGSQSVRGGSEDLR